MTFLGANKLKLSQHVFTCLDNRTQASSLSIVELNSTIYTQQNYFNYTPTVSTSTHRITLPAGKYYLEGALSVQRSTAGTWYLEYVWRTYDSTSATYTTIGHEGRENGVLNMGNPYKNQIATAYVESASSIELSIWSQGSSSCSINNTQYLPQYGGKSRLAIWRLQ